jgi:single-strand DNA-binding protein
MASFNRITIVGYCGRDPELRYTPTGNAVCKLSVATSEKRRDEESTTWFRISVWGKQGELCNEYLRKGSQVYVEGRVRVEEYTDRDGGRRYSLEVTATDVQFLGRKTENGGDTAPQRLSDEERGARSAALKNVPQDDDIPF